MTKQESLQELFSMTHDEQVFVSRFWRIWARANGTKSQKILDRIFDLYVQDRLTFQDLNERLTQFEGLQKMGKEYKQFLISR